MAKKTTQPKRLDANVGSGFAQAALGLEKSKVAFDIAKSQQGGQMIGAVEGVFSDYITKSEETKDKFLNEVDDTYEVNLLGDENLKQKFVDFATETKSFINENIETASKYSSNPSSKQYKEAVKNIEKGKNGLQKVFSQAQAMQKRRVDAIAMGKGGNKTIPSGDYRDAMNNNFITGGLYKDLDITLDDGIYYDAGEGNIIPGESIGGNINFENAGLGKLVTKDFIEDPIKLKKQGQNETTTRDLLQRRAHEMFKDSKNVRQAVFNGVNGQSDTRYIDYYILERHMAGDEAFKDLKFQDTNKDGQINNEDKIDGEFVLDKNFVNDRGEASQTAFDNHVERLKRDKDIDFSQGVKDFFVDMGMGVYSGAEGESDSGISRTPLSDARIAEINIFKNSLKKAAESGEDITFPNGDKGKITSSGNIQLYTGENVKIEMLPISLDQAMDRAKIPLDMRSGIEPLSSETSTKGGSYSQFKNK